MATRSTVSCDDLNLDEAIADHRLDFDSWTILISHIENKCSDDIEKLSSVYDSFLSEFPLCCGYWSKYAAHKARLCSVEDAVEVYEKAVEIASFSVHIWSDYCTFATTVFEDPFDVTRLFRRGLSYIGKDYLCDALWDKYIEFEFSQKQWCSLSQIYIEALKFPTKKLHQYYDSLKKLVTIWEEDIGCLGDSNVKLQPETRTYEEFTAPENEVSFVISDLLEPSTRSEAIKKYLYIGEYFYQRASLLDKKIHCFEKSINRTYFHVNTLDNDQLENWHHYLDFVQMTGDFDWAVKLYERCLIPCASYSEFWMRYVEYLESKGGREIANDALQRATQIFFKDFPAIHLFSAGYKEQIGDICGARTAILHTDVHSESSFVDCVMRRANLERRLGNNVAASNVYKEALAVAKREMPNTLPILYIQFSRLQYMVTSSIDASKDILIDGFRNVVNCKQLLEELIILAVNHEAARHISILDPIVDGVIMPSSDVSSGLSYKDKLDISELYLKFIDLCGTVYDSRRAWNRHIKSFPDSLRADPMVMQRISANSLKKILSDGSQSATCINKKEAARTDEMNPLIQPSEDSAEKVKDDVDKADTCKEDQEGDKLVSKVAGIELVEDDKSDQACDKQEEQIHLSGGDESPIVDILSLDGPYTESHYIGSMVNHGCECNQEACPSESMLISKQGTEPQTLSILSEAVINTSAQAYCESPTPSYSNLPTSKTQKDPDSCHSSPNRQSPMKYVESQKYKASSLSEQSQSPSARERLSPNEKGFQSFPERRHQNRPVYFDNSKAKRVGRFRNERWGRSGYGRRGRYNQPERPSSTSQAHPPAQPSANSLAQTAHYPVQQQSNDEHGNEAYNQMWQYYYYYQQQQLALVQQQQQQSYPKPEAQFQSQGQEESQANQMQQILQFPYQQMQQYQQVQQQEQEVGQQSGTQEQEVAQQIQLQQQQQIQSYQYQQQYLLYLQQLQQLQQQPGPPGVCSQAERLSTPEKEEHNEAQGRVE